MARYYKKIQNGLNHMWRVYTVNDIYFKQNGIWVKGDVSQLTSDTKYIYEELDGQIKVAYLSLGDSIAAGHAIDSDWEKNYGGGSQYGKNGNTQTAIVPNSYTDLITKDFKNTYGSTNVTSRSYAVSGSRVDDLMTTLTHQAAIEYLQEADFITICIGANDVLEPALSHLEDYISIGASVLEQVTQDTLNNLTLLADDSYQYSMTALLNRLYEINPTATYIFTNVYNPYKYLHIEEGQNGFFKPMLDTIPQMNLDIDEIIENMFGINDLSYWDISKWKWVSIELEYDLDGAIKNTLLSMPIVQQLFSRVNGLGAYAENLILQLNNILVDKITTFNKPNFRYIDTKTEFEKYPDRTVEADVHYNDLVNVEFTRGYTTGTMDWGALWRDDYGTSASAIEQYWKDLIWKYITFKNGLPSLDVNDYIFIDWNGFAEDLTMQIVMKVVKPNVDAHPETYGHYVMQQLFTTNINTRMG